MKKLLQLSLGIMTALGGFVDIGELVFASQAGARFGYSLLWTLAFGTVGIMVYSEMCGRIAAVKQKPVFAIVHDRLNPKLGIIALISSNIVNIMTCAAELGGLALVLEMLTGWPYRLDVVIAGVALLLLIWFLPFKWEERFFGLLGLLMLVFAAAAIKLGPNWHLAATSLLPNMPHLDSHGTVLYWYFVIGIISAVMMPYEVYFYSSGGVEENWKSKDLPENTFISVVGMSLGSMLTMALTVIGAILFMPKGIYPDLLGTAALGPATAYGRLGLMLGLCGILFSVSGSAVETGLSGAYNLAQFRGWKWGRKYKAKETPRFTATWIIIFIISIGIALSGVDPVQLVEYSVMFAVVVLPLTYYPVLVAAKDKSFMGKHVNSRWQTALGWFYFVVVVICCLAAIPLMLMTNVGSP